MGKAHVQHKIETRSRVHNRERKKTGKKKTKPINMKNMKTHLLFTLDFFFFLTD